ncbi:hypothetical protein I4200191B4_16110 [Pseudoflavonifractor gallinarum]
MVEKSNSIYAKENYTDAQVQRNILSNPFKRFEDMQMLHHTKNPGRDPSGRVCLEEADSGGKAGDRADLRREAGAVIMAASRLHKRMVISNESRDIE